MNDYINRRQPQHHHLATTTNNNSCRMKIRSLFKGEAVSYWMSSSLPFRDSTEISSIPRAHSTDPVQTRGFLLLHDATNPVPRARIVNDL